MNQSKQLEECPDCKMAIGCDVHGTKFKEGVTLYEPKDAEEKPVIDTENCWCGNGDDCSCVLPPKDVEEKCEHEWSKPTTGGFQMCLKSGCNAQIGKPANQLEPKPLNTVSPDNDEVEQLNLLLDMLKMHKVNYLPELLTKPTGIIGIDQAFSTFKIWLSKRSQFVPLNYNEVHELLGRHWNVSRTSAAKAMCEKFGTPSGKSVSESNIFNILHNTVIGLQDKGDGSRDFMTKGDADKLATAIWQLLSKNS